jgi:hypothetical protein
VLVRHPRDTKQSLLRRIAALEGDEMESSDPQDEPFRIEPNSCWVLADNQDKKPSVSTNLTWSRVSLNFSKSFLGLATYSGRADVSF